MKTWTFAVEKPAELSVATWRNGVPGVDLYRARGGVGR